MSLAQEAEQFLAEGDKASKGGFFSKPSWDIAGQFYEKAATGFRGARQFPRAVETYIKASDALQKGNAFFMSAKQMEQAATIATTNMRDLKRGAALYKRASDIYVGSGHPDQAAGALEKGAKSLEYDDTQAALSLYEAACSIYETEERGRFGVETFQKVSTLQLKNKMYDEAIGSFGRQAKLFETLNNANGASRANLGIIIILLFKGQIPQAEAMFEKLSSTSFSTSEDWETASQILQAYETGDQAMLQSIVNDSKVQFLDNEIIRLARGLQVPKGGTGSKISSGISDPTVHTGPSVLSQYESKQAEYDDDDLT